MSRHISRLGGLIAAAGQSRRMGAFKPMLELGGEPLIWRSVESLRSLGIKRIVVVAGREAETLENLLIPRGVTVVRNLHYTKNQMLDSVKLGLETLTDTEGLFFLPGDVPLVAQHTVRLLLAEAQRGADAVIYPTYGGRRGHPPFISQRCYAKILDYQGPRGLAGALTAWEAREIAVPDAGCVLDCDTPSDYRRLCQYWDEKRYPDDEHCRAIWDWAGTPERVIRHCQAVAVLADKLAARLTMVGRTLNLALVHSGALLHDVLRTEPVHDLSGAALLAEMGCCELAAVLKEHMALSAEAAAHLDERAVVFLADKLVRETERVSIAERYAPALKRFAPDTEAGAAIRQQMRRALEVQKQIEQLTGIAM